MKPVKIKIYNWKSIKDIELKINNLNILVGKNSFGKTNILTALLFFFNKIKFDESYIRKGGEEGFIEIEFEDGEGKEIIKKSFSKEEVKVERKEGEIYNKYPNYDGRSKVFKEPITDEIYYIPALLKDSNEEISPKNKSNFLNKVIDNLFSNLQDEEEFRNINDNFTLIKDKMNKDGNGEYYFDKIKELKENIEEELSNWDCRFDFEFNFPDFREIIKLNTNYIFDDGTETDLENKGMGFQRNFLFVLLKVFNKLKNNNKKFILLFEEPEIYLHPQMQRELYSILKTLAEGGNTIFLTTHSGYFLELRDYKSIIKLEKKSNNTNILQIKDDLFEFEGDDRLRQEKVRNLNLTFWLNPERNEVFFADKVILVEGPSEKIAIPILINEFLPSYFKFSYSIINCENKQNQVAYIGFLNAFKIKYVSVYDSDGEKDFPEIENKIDENLGYSIILENNLADELEIDEGSNNKPFKIYQEITKDNFEICNNIKEKLRKIYE